MKELHSFIIYPFRKLKRIYRFFINGAGLVSKKNAPSHPLVRKETKNGLDVYEIEKEITVNIFPATGKDTGYHKYSNAWWYNLDCPYAYSYINIDSLYPKQYFSTEDTGHPDQKASAELYAYMQSVYTAFFSKPFTSLLELGTGGGEITIQFQQHQIDYLAVEGTQEGYARLKEIGIPENRILLANLKRMEPLNRRFDLVMCTEVIEHIEPFFAAKVVEACTLHANAVWFSAADRNRSPHYHHCNEISIEAWDNLFACFGFNRHIKLSNLHARGERLYLSDAATG